MKAIEDHKKNVESNELIKKDFNIDREREREKEREREREREYTA